MTVDFPEAAGPRTQTPKRTCSVCHTCSALATRPGGALSPTLLQDSEDCRLHGLISLPDRYLQSLAVA